MIAGKINQVADESFEFVLRRRRSSRGSPTRPEDEPEATPSKDAFPRSWAPVHVPPREDDGGPETLFPSRRNEPSDAAAKRLKDG